MRITRSIYRALLQQQQGGCADTQPPGITIDKLPEDVVLEIFDSYRQVFQRQDNYEDDWNDKDGWFKLAHVCQNWRRIVLASPSRLHLRLVFTPRMPQRAIVPGHLPPLPIFINYGTGVPTDRQRNRMLFVLKDPNRVWGIKFRGTNGDLQILFRAMDRPFPALESLELLRDNEEHPEFHLPITFLQDSVQRLRHLKLLGTPFSSLSRFLSSTTGLTDLSLTVKVDPSLSPAAWLLTHLQAMPSLRRLELSLTYCDRIGTIIVAESSVKAENIVRLSNLTYLHLHGQRADLEGLLARLVTPSLQDLSVNFYDLESIHTPPFPHLSRFIRAIARPVSAAKAIFGPGNLLTSMLHSIDGLSIRISISDIRGWLEWMGSTLGVTLSTVEDVLLTCGRDGFPFWPFPRLPWRKFLEQFLNAKILRLRHEIVLSILRFLRWDDGSGLLPALEQIELHAAGSRELANEHQRTAVLDKFGPFVAERRRAGRPVKVFWKTDGVLPEYFCGADGRDRYGRGSANRCVWAAVVGTGTF